MRCSFLQYLPLFVAIYLLIADTSLGSPTNHDQREALVSSSNVPARSLDTPRYHAAKRSAAPDDMKRHLYHRRDKLDQSNHPSPALLQRHNHIMDHLRLHSSDFPLAKRNLASDLTIMGFRLIWDHADVIVSSSLAYYRTTEYYANMTILAGGEFGFGPTVQNHVIVYGYFRLSFEYFVTDVAPQMAEHLFPNGFGQFVQEFAEVMLVLTSAIVIGTYRVLAWSATTVVWITMIVVDNVDLRDMVPKP